MSGFMYLLCSALLLHAVIGQKCDSESSTCNLVSSSTDAVPAEDVGAGEHVSLLQGGLRGVVIGKHATQGTTAQGSSDVLQKEKDVLIAKIEALQEQLNEKTSKTKEDNCVDDGGTSIYGLTCVESARFCHENGLKWANPPRTTAFACPLTCGQCLNKPKDCKDTKSDCWKLADLGFCKNETGPEAHEKLKEAHSAGEVHHTVQAMSEAEMHEYCPKSCGVCENLLLHQDTRMIDAQQISQWNPKEGLMASVMPGVSRPKLIFGMDVDYPPYAYLREQPYDSRIDLDEVVGVGADMIKAMAKHCGFDVSVMQVHWSDCWGNGQIGNGLLQGWYHGCMTYTHATGTRNRYLDFTNSWAKPNKPAGLIVKLTDGKPKFDGFDSLDGRTIVDVTGWAPTADTLNFVENKCTGEPYKGFKVVQGDDLMASHPKAKGANDRALLAVLEDKADAMWIYGDQAENYQCSEGTDEEGWNCDLWKGFGKTFAYVQSGMYGWMHNGTTIAMTKKGSGVASYLDHCFESFRHTPAFYHVCAKEHHGHSQLSTCIPNKYFKEDPHFEPWSIEHNPWMFPTNEHTDRYHKPNCHTGYCGCHG